MHCLQVGRYNSSLLQYISVALLLLLLLGTWQNLSGAGLPFLEGQEIATIFSFWKNTEVLLACSTRDNVIPDSLLKVITAIF